ncbi:hypothetical protein HAX54_013984 [Datura stramonium]|uniref:EF-hand domain-containing protein n=1 Tax=Datura stramonium TaxID=4076 RepID=A0ABS8RYJ6_DATST|nr:hypothetical protein [Datura stramonium]
MKGRKSCWSNSAYSNSSTTTKRCRRTWRELEFRDKDGDGAISFSEYLPQFTNEDIERNETSHGEAGWWWHNSQNADADRSGTLNLYEFRDFMHPEDSRNENIQRWLLREKIRQMDVNKDHKLNRLEFSMVLTIYIKRTLNMNLEEPIFQHHLKYLRQA